MAQLTGTAAGAVQAILPADAAMAVSYDPWLVAASIAIAVMASFTGLRLASGLKDLDGAARRRQLAKAALTLGGGIWSMHFVAMLAVKLPVLVSYDALYTLGSVLISILIVGIGLSLMHVGARTWSRTIFAGTLTGLGIVSMHYVGMDAIGGACIVDYRFGGAIASSAVAIGFSICAIRLAYGRRTLLQLCLGALLLGVTIAAMHYSAMAFTRFLPVPETWSLATPEIDQGQLALIVAVAAFLVCGLFLLTAMPLDGRASAGGAGTDDDGAGLDRAGGTADMPAPAAAGLAAGALLGVTAQPALAGDAQPALAGGGGAAEAAPLRAAFFDGGATAGAPAAVAEPAANAPEAHPAARMRLPYEQNNATLFIDAGRVQAVQADGHYTRLIDGAGRHFCPWSLSKVEAHLAGGPFIRTHRSFLVNLDHASGLRRERDKAFLMLPAMNDDPVPVSRSHLAEVRRALGL